VKKKGRYRHEENIASHWEKAIGEINDVEYQLLIEELDPAFAAPSY
jgi:hypothetical protein